MTVNKKLPDVIKLGKDLKPGDIIRSESGSKSAAIIMKINHLSRFYDGRPHYEFFSLNCCSCGTYTGHLDMNKKYKIIQNRDDIISIFDRVELELLRHAANVMDSRRELVSVKTAVFNDLSDKLYMEKKKSR